MASGPLVQVPLSAVDLAGLSVSTAVRTPTDPRTGAVYDQVNLAAAIPVYFHPMTNPALGGGNFMMLCSQRWTNATPLSTDPGFSSAHTVDPLPSWVLVHAATGGSTALNSGYEIPIATAGITSPTLRGAVSHGVDMLYTLISCAQGAIVQHWHNNTAINTLNPVSEELIPTAHNATDTVVFDAGIDYAVNTDPYMVFYGRGDVSGSVYMARKRWSRVGSTQADKRGEHDGSWEFYDGQGWVLTTSTLGAVQTTQGPLHTDGPLSFAHYTIARAQIGIRTAHAFLATTVAAGAVRTAQVYESLGGRPWKPLGAPIALGSVGSTYLGGTLQFQGQLGANPALVDTVNSVSAIPYVVSTLLTSGGASQIHPAWGVLQIPRQS